MALLVHGSPAYTKTIFIGAAVDVEPGDGEADRFVGTADRFLEALKKGGSHVEESSGTNTFMLRGKRATASAVELALVEAARESRESDRVVVTLVCHGDETHFRLAPEGTNGESRLEMAKLRTLFEKIPARHKLLVVDGCYAGALMAGLGPFAGVDEASGEKVPLDRPVGVIWTSKSAGQTTASSVSGPVFLSRVCETLEKKRWDATPLTIRSVRDSGGVLGSLPGSGDDLYLSGDIKPPPELLPGQPREEPQGSALEGSRKRLAASKRAARAETTRTQALHLLEALEAWQGLTSREIALKEGGEGAGDWEEDAKTVLAVFTEADGELRAHLRAAEIVAYLLETKGQWNIDREALTRATLLRQKAASLAEGTAGKEAHGKRLIRLGNSFAFLGMLGDLASARKAVAHYRSSLELMSRHSQPEIWAMAQRNLGASLQLVSRNEGDEAKKAAYVAYGEALAATPRTSSPIAWAEAQEGLANTLHKNAVIGPQRLEAKLRSFNLALEVLTAESAPLSRAKTLSNKGLTIASSADEGDLPKIEEAIMLHRQALALLNEASPPFLRVQIELNLSEAILQTHPPRESALLTEAEALSQQALGRLTAAGMSTQWARAHYILGGIYYAQGDGEGREKLLKAESAFTNALLVWTQEDYPDKWASVMARLGLTLFALAELGDAGKRHNAEAIFRKVLELGSSKMPMRIWSSVINNLGALVMDHFQPRTRETLDEAISIFQRGLKEVGDKEWPTQWARMQWNLGLALRRRGQLGDRQKLEESIDAFRATLQVYSKESHPEDWAETHKEIAVAQRLLGELGDAGRIRESEASYRLAMQVYSRSSFPEQWAQIQRAVGNALSVLGDESAPEMLQDAISAYALALGVWTRETSAEDWSGTLFQMSAARLSLGLKGGAGQLEKAASSYLTLFDWAMNHQTNEPFYEGAAMCAIGLARAYEAGHDHPKALKWAREAISAADRCRDQGLVSQAKALLKRLESLPSQGAKNPPHERQVT